jgi:hypothetical protein
VVAHITEVLSKGDTSVDGGLTSSDGHVRGVGYKASTKHDTALLSIDDSGKLRELLKYLSHLISTLSASDINDCIRVRVLGKSLRDTGLATTEGTWDSASTTLH